MDNIALVVLDTLRKDTFDQYFDWLPGMRFESAWSTGCWTVPAHGSLFTGKYPSEVGVHAKHETLDCPEEVLAEHLNDRGYTTRAFSCNPYVSEQFMFDRGFEKFEGSWRLKSFNPDIFDWNRFISETRDEGVYRFPRAIWECIRSDCLTLPSLRYGLRLKTRDLNLKQLGGVDDDGALRMLKTIQRTNFSDGEFFFANLMEAHAPYDPPADYRTVRPSESPGLLATVTGTDTDPVPVKRAYEDSVRYLSDIYERIFTELSADFDYIITLGDHGELFGEHGCWRHAHGLHTELVHVPLVVYDSTDETTVIEEPVNLLDVHRTILDLAGIESDTRGRSVFEDLESRPPLTEYQGLNHQHVHSLEEAGIEADSIDQYDQQFQGIVTDGGLYGYESVDGFRTSGEDVEESKLQESLNNLVATLQVRQLNDEGAEEIPESVRQQLEDLGYA